MTPLILHQTPGAGAASQAETARRNGWELRVENDAGLLVEAARIGSPVVVLGPGTAQPLTLLARLAAEAPGAAVLVAVDPADADRWRRILTSSPLAPARTAVADASQPESWTAQAAALAALPLPAPSPLAALAHQLCACAPAGFAVVDASGLFVSANPQLVEIIGRDERALAGRDLAFCFGNETAAALAGGPPPGGAPVRFSLRRPDGTVRDLEATSGPLPLADGSPGRLLAFRDISRRTRAEAGLARSELRLRQVVDLVPHMIFLKDAAGRFALVNQEAANLYGTTVEKLTDRLQADLHSDADELQAMLLSDQAVLNEGRRVDAPETRFTSPTGETRWLSVIKVPFRPDSQGEPMVLGIALDVTELRRARAELEAANRGLEERVQARTAELEAAGHALLHERHLFSTLLDNLPERIYFKDRDSRFIRGNHAILRQFGLSREEELVGKSDADCFTPEHAAPARADELRIMETGVPILEKEERETFTDGTVTWSATTKMPLRDKQGRIIGTFGVSRDITARKRMEQELEQERLLMSNLMDSLPDKIFFKDRESRFLRVNKAHAAQFNLASPEAAAGRTDSDYFSPENAAAARTDELGIMATGEALINSEMQEVVANGKRRWISVTKLPLRDLEGAIIGTFGVVRDITARRKAEADALKATDEAVRASKLLKVIIDSIPDRIVVKDTEGRMTMNNRAHRRFLGGAKHKEAMGRLITDLFDTPWARAALEQDLRVIRTGEREVNHEEFVKLDEHDKGHWMLTSKVPLRRKKDEPPFGVVVISHDITKRKKTEEKLRLSRERLQRRNEVMNTDLEMARQVQQAFLPDKFPEFPAGSGPQDATLAFGRHYEASSNLAGDFFNVIRLSDTRAGLLVCDVLGHGLRAALFTAMIRGLIEEMRPIADDPGAFLTEINKGLCKIVLPADESPIFVTACYIVVDVAIKRFRYASAGHPAPLLLRAADGSVTPLDSMGDECDPPLGLEDGLVYAGRRGTLAAGDTFLLFTDGLTEAQNAKEEEFGDQRLREALVRHADKAPQELANSLVDEARRFSGKTEFPDDVCVLTVRVLRTPGAE